MQKAALVLLVTAGCAAWGQNNATPANDAATSNASAYYHYALGHMYAEMAGEPGGREYIDKAVSEFKAALKADPNSSAISEELANFYIEAGLLADAESDAQATLKQNPKDLAALRMLARIYMSQIGGQQGRINQDMLKKAIEQFQKITEVAPTDTQAWVMLGNLQQASNDFAEAEKAFKKALDVEPDNEDALTGLSVVYLDLGNSQAAADMLRMMKNPSYRTLTRLAEAYEMMKEYSLAADSLKRALALNPPDPVMMRMALGGDLMQAHRYDEALGVYQQLVDDDPMNADAYLRISQVYQQQKKFNQAREALNKALAIQPDNLDYLYNEVGLLQAEGKPDQAISTLKDILDSTARLSNNQRARAVRIQLLDNLAELYEQNGQQTELAVQTLRQVADLDPDEAPQAAAEIVGVYREDHEFGKAQQEADANLKKWPDDRNSHIAHAELMADLGKNDQAVAEVKKLLDGKNDLQTYEKLAEIYNKAHKYDDALKSLDSAEKLASTDEQKKFIWFERGVVYEKTKKIDMSEGEFRKVLKVDPDNANALNYIGYVLADRNTRLPESLDLITKALDLEPENGAFLDSLGWVYFRLGRLKEAEDNLRRAVAKTPADPTVHDHMAQVLAAESKTQEAVQEWQNSLKNWDSGAPADLEPAEVAKVKTNLESAKSRLAKEAKQQK